MVIRVAGLAKRCRLIFRFMVFELASLKLRQSKTIEKLIHVTFMNIPAFIQKFL
jgi:hypothetical protein